MNLFIMLMCLLLAKKALAIGSHLVLPHIRYRLDAALSNDVVWLGAWAMVVLTVGAALAMAYSQGRLG